MKYYSLDENHNFRTLSSRYIACKNPYQLQNLKILSTFQGHKNAYGENFWNLNLFLSEKTRLHRYYQNKNQLEATSCSYTNRTMKLSMKLYLLAQKQGKSEYYFFGEAVSHFCFR